MQKFTVFSILLTIIIVVVVAEIIVTDYLPKWNNGGEYTSMLDFALPESLDVGETTGVNIFGSGLNDLVANSEPVTTPIVRVPEDAVDLINMVEETVSLADSSSDLDFEDSSFVNYTPNVYIREEQVRSAGFATAYLEDDTHDGYFFKSIYVGDLNDVELKKTIVRDASRLFAKVYVFSFGPNTSISSAYETLKVRAAEGLNVEINSNNEFGDASFYMNDVKRQSTAFLTVKIASNIYGFSYPKEYHPQIKNLIKLIELEQ
jgi:hypothetical protein